MPSRIDPTRFVDGQPVSKAELRAALGSAKAELEHGGFFKSPGNDAFERTVSARLGDDISAKDFGALGDGTAKTVGTAWIGSGRRFADLAAARAGTGLTDLAATDTVDWAALQMALNVGVGVHVPTGDYLINRTLFSKNMRITGTKGRGWSTPARSRIQTTSGFGQRPMLLFADWWFDWNYTIQGSGNASGGEVYLADICFSNTDPNGMVGQFPGITSCSKIERSWIGSSGRGVAINGAYEVSIENCYIGGFLNYGNRETEWENIDWKKGVGLYAHNHCTVTCCTFTRCGIGLSAQGNGVHVSGCRAEENVLGYEIGYTGLVPYTNADAGVPFVSYGFYRSSMLACSAEANRYAIRLKLNRASSIRDVEVQGSTNRTPGSRGQGAIGFAIYGIDGSATVEGISTFGGFEDAAIRYVGSASAVGPHKRIRYTQSNAARPGYAGSAVLIGKNPHGDLSYHLERHPLNPTVQTGGNTNGTTTAFSDLGLRSITGLRYHQPHVQANNLGGLVAVANGGTTAAVTFPAGTSRHDPSLIAAQNDGSSTLAAGTYYYGVTLQNRRGECALDALDVTPCYKTVIVRSGQRVRVQAWNGPGYRVRVYRGTAVYTYDGYFCAPEHSTGGTVTFDDIGQAFDGIDEPPLGGTQIPTSHEPDANYAIVATPSWGTTVHVASKATSGFTLNFGTAAPDANQTVQWLLFRP